MNTLQTQLSKENESTKLIFRALFLFQLELEDRSGNSFRGDQENEELIRTIDSLMELLIHYYETEKG